MKRIFLSLALLVAVLVPAASAGIRTVSADRAEFFLSANGVAVGVQAETPAQQAFLRNSGASEFATWSAALAPTDDETVGSLPSTTVNDGQTYTTSWQSGPNTHTILTPKKRNENATLWVHRHAQALSAAQAAFPPNP